MRLLTLSKKNWSEYGARLQALESVAEYPYGDDFFRLDHGPSYFAFFERMGEPVFQVALEDREVIACAAGVLRKIPTAGGFLRAWYLCDLKVHPDFRGRGIPARLMGKNLWRHYLRAGRAYAISMNPRDGENHVPRITARFAFVPIGIEARLHVYGMDFEQIERAAADISRVVGPISYLSLERRKDLIMRSSGERLNLLHVQHGPFAEPRIQRPRPGATHMICAPAGSALDRALGRLHPPSATASVLGHRVRGVDWSFVLTSEI